MPKLNHLQNITLNLLGSSPLKEKFYWTGGTALAVLYLNHRTSEDLDFFTKKPFGYEELTPFIDTLKDETGLKTVEEKKVYDRREFFFHNKETLRIEFVQYAFPALKKRKKWKGILVDSLDDIACNKTMALFDRNEPKDLFDLYYLLTRSGYRVPNLLKMVEKKFGVRFQEMSFWSETHKTIKNLHELKPLLPMKTNAAKERLLQRIEDYFINQSTKRLRTFLE